MLYSRLHRLVRFVRAERGSVTAEYAIVVLAAVSLAGLMVAIMRGGEVKSLLFDLVKSALSLG